MYGIILECLKKYPNGITVTELMRKEPELSFQQHTFQEVVFWLRALKSDGKIKRKEKPIKPIKKMILVGVTESGNEIRFKGRIETYCRKHPNEQVTVQWKFVELGKKQILYSLV